MFKATAIFAGLFLALSWLSFEPAFNAGENKVSFQRKDLAIIVHKSNPVENLSMAELREYFLAERSHWSHRQKIRVAMRETGSPEREAVLKLVCGMNRDQDLTTYFLRAKFSEQVIEEPRSLDSAPNMIRFVANVSGALGYVRADEVDPSVRVIRVDNLLPGDPGYKLTMR